MTAPDIAFGVARTDAVDRRRSLADDGTSPGHIVADGRLGRKAKKGFYTYAEGKKKEVDESIYALMPHGKDRKRFDRAEMAEC